MRGDIVTVKTFGGETVSRLVWDESDEMVYVVNEESYRLLMNGERAPTPIGFPRSDIVS